MQQCAVCSQTLLDKNSPFCFSCGHAAFKNATFYDPSKSTADFDPLGRFSKPWKDKPLVKVRKYPPARDKPLPWYPTMRQSNKPCRSVMKVKVIPASMDEEHHEEGEAEPDSPSDPSAQQDQMTERSEVQEGIILSDEAAIAATPRIFKKEFVRFRSSPLAAYDLLNADTQSTLCVTLLETSWGSSASKCFWLRITLLIAPEHSSPIDGNEENEDVEDSCEVITLAHLSDAVGRLVVPRREDWVDLAAINANEFYVEQFMQRMLICLCPLVKPRADFQSDLIYDATVRDFALMNQKNSEKVDEYGRSCVARQTLQIVCRCTDRAQDIINGSSTHVSFCFDDRIATFSGTVRLARSALLPFCPVLVHVRVQHRRAPFNLQHAEEMSMLRDEFIQCNRATHLLLLIQPELRDISLSQPVPSASFTFDASTLHQLLKEEPDLHEIIERSCESLDVLERYIVRLLNLLRLEQTDQGIRYSLVGAFADPPFISCPWPPDVERELSRYADIDDEDVPVPPAVLIPEEDEHIIIPNDHDNEDAAVEEVNEESAESQEERSINLEQSQFYTLATEMEHEEVVEEPCERNQNIFFCPLHEEQNCPCYQADATVRGTSVRVFIDLSTLNINFDESKEVAMEELEELFVAVVDISSGKEGLWSGNTYTRGKTAITTLRGPTLRSLIEDFYMHNKSDQSQCSEDLFAKMLIEHLDLFKSEANKFLKLSVK